MSKSGSDKDSTLAALLRDRPKRGRPRREVSRENVYIELSEEQKQLMSDLGESLPEEIVRADVADLSIMVLAARLEALRRAVAGRTREIPEGITDLDSLYLLWDLPSPDEDVERRWTSIRVSPQQSIDLGRAHGTLNALFGATRSEVFGLGLALLSHFVTHEYSDNGISTLPEMKEHIRDLFL